MTKNLEAYENLVEYRSRCKKDYLSYRDAKYLRAKEIAINEVKLRECKKSWKTFCKHKLWKNRRARDKPKVEDDSTALHYSFIFAYADITDSRDMPSLHHRAVQALLIQGVSRSKIAEELKNNGGFTGVIKKYGGDNAKKNKASKEKDEPVIKKFIFDPEKQLVVDVIPPRLRKISRQKEGKTFWLECKRGGRNEDGLFIIKVVGYEDL